MILIRFRNKAHHAATYLQALLLAMPILLGSLPHIYAADLTVRSVRVSTAQAAAPAQHTFTFNIPSTSAIGSMAFEYCDSPLPSVACVAPVGLDLSSVTWLPADQTGNIGFSISAPDSTANKIVITRPSSAGVATTSSYAFSNLINPTTAAQTAFVRISTHASTDGTGPSNDSGSVAFATASSLQVDAYVPPFITFCVGVFVTLNCNSVTGSKIDVGELKTDLTATGSLQFSGATNDFTGFTTYLTGTTMTSGNNIINALSTNAGSVQGTSQFGLNLRANTNPTAGLDPVGAGSSTAAAGYNVPNSFRFVSGEVITSSSVATDFRLFTATYIVNVPNSQPPGVYATTMTLTAIASSF